MIKVTLLKSSEAWQNLLTQMGFCYEIPEDHKIIFKKQWRFWLHEWEAAKARLHFKRKGYPQNLEKS